MTSTRSYFNPSVLLNFNDIEKPVQAHLKNVYTILAAGLSVCALTTFAFVWFPAVRTMMSGLSIISFFATLGSIFYLTTTPHSSSTLKSRMGAFFLLAASTGLGLGPLVHYTGYLNPEILPTAFFTTALVFVSFSMAALYSKRRTFIYLGGTLLSGLSALLVLGLLNIFFKSTLIFDVQLYVGLLIFCGFILYDTQLICEKVRMGDKDFIWHALDLFLDCVQLFRHILVLLSKKEENNNNRRNRQS